VAGVSIQYKGDKIVMHYHAVNHDEDVFGDDALTFDIHRMKRMPTLNREIRSFGIGQHFCLGINLARLEMRVMFEELLPRLKEPATGGRYHLHAIVLHFDDQSDADRIYTGALGSTSRNQCNNVSAGKCATLVAREG
jgi:cytochrome P450